MSHKLSMPPSASERDGRTLAQLTARTRENSPCRHLPHHPLRLQFPQQRRRCLRRDPRLPRERLRRQHRCAQPRVKRIRQPRPFVDAARPPACSAIVSRRPRAGPPARSATGSRKANGQMTRRPRLDRMAEPCSAASLGGSPG